MDLSKKFFMETVFMRTEEQTKNPLRMMVYASLLAALTAAGALFSIQIGIHAETCVSAPWPADTREPGGPRQYLASTLLSRLRTNARRLSHGSSIENNCSITVSAHGFPQGTLFRLSC